MSKLATILGVLLALLVVFTSMVDFSQMRFITAFFDLQSALIVMGGVMAATLINYPINRLGCVFSAFVIVFSRESLYQQEVIDELLDLSIMVKRQGKLVLEEYAEDTKQHFLKIALMETLNTSDVLILRRNLDNELNSMRLRHAACQDVFHNMASYAPAFGMLGTVMGLIIMMTSQGETSSVAVFGASQSQDMMGKLLSGMGLALVTTFYGVVLSNLVFLPIAGKLKSLSDSEQHAAEIIIVGMMSIHRLDSPLRMKDELLTFVSKKIREDVDRSRLQETE
jgi:chemotaxis protein MotA